MFVQLDISFPVLIFYSLVDMRMNIAAPFVLFLSYVSDRRGLSFSDYKLENFIFAWIGFNIDNFKSNFILLISYLASGSNALAMQAVR